MQKCLIAPSIWELKVSFVFDILYRFILYYWKSWSRNPMVTPVFMCDLPVKVIMNFQGQTYHAQLFLCALQRQPLCANKLANIAQKDDLITYYTCHIQDDQLAVNLKLQKMKVLQYASWRFYLYNQHIGNQGLGIQWWYQFITKTSLSRSFKVKLFLCAL